MATVRGDDGVSSGMVPNAPYGVWGDSGSNAPGGYGVIGTSKNYSGVVGETLNAGTRAAGVYGAGHVGVAGAVTNATTAPSTGVGVYGTGSNDGGLNAIGVQGVSDSNVGVEGDSLTGIGVQGVSSRQGYNFGVVGRGPNAGVAAFNPNNNHAAYLASDCCAAWFTGDVRITGTLFKGGGGFRIDHPLDPTGKYLSHSFVESSDMKTFYDGTVVADDRGTAVVELPAWFEALNTDFRYQLTAVGGPTPQLHVSREIRDGGFEISGATAGTTVCWQVTARRQDRWARANAIPVESEKPQNEREHYLHPELHDASEDMSVARVRHPH